MSWRSASQKASAGVEVDRGTDLFQNVTSEGPRRSPQPSQHSHRASFVDQSLSSGHGASSVVSVSPDLQRRVGNESNNDEGVNNYQNNHSQRVLSRGLPPTAPSLFTSSSSPPHPTNLQVPPWPPPVEEPRRKNWFAVYDPQLDPKKSRGKEIIYRYDGRTEPGQPELEVMDPRLEARRNGKDLTGRGMRKCRATFYTLEWEVCSFVFR